MISGSWMMLVVGGAMGWLVVGGGCWGNFVYELSLRVVFV